MTWHLPHGLSMGKGFRKFEGRRFQLSNFSSLFSKQHGDICTWKPDKREVFEVMMTLYDIGKKKTLLYLTRQNILYIWNTTVAPWTTPVKLDWTAIYTIFVFEIAFESLRIHWRIPMRIAMRILEWILDGLILCMYGIRGSSQGSSLYTFLTRLYITLKTVCRFNRMVIGLAKLRP
jgi:hypothetical protein